jgi:hypothetical protein
LDNTTTKNSRYKFIRVLWTTVLNYCGNLKLNKIIITNLSR